MAEKKVKRAAQPKPAALFAVNVKKKHPRLFLGKYLTEEAQKTLIPDEELARVSAVLKHWADLAMDGHLNKKETSLDGQFLEKIFGQALGYKNGTDSPNDYHYEEQYFVPGAGPADGAVGMFVSGKAVAPTAIVALKGAQTDLDHDKFNGRTPVQQLWDYLNQLPDTQWGILSNYVTIRLYHKSHPMRAYDEFTVNDFLDPNRIREFYYVFQKDGLVGNKAVTALPRAALLLNKTQTRQREVGDKLYDYYSSQREALIGELMDNKGMTQDAAIHAAQRLLDRIIFMAFCEDRGLAPPRLIEETWGGIGSLPRTPNPRWRCFLEAFYAFENGHPNLDLPAGYGGGLFRHDPLIDELQLGDEWTDVFKTIGEYDFSEDGEIGVEVLSQIFGKSMCELDR